MNIDAQLHLEINKEADPLLSKITGGRCADYAEYKRDTGYLAGLNKALDIHMKILNQADQDDE